MPVAYRPKGKAKKIRDAVMGPLPNEPKKNKKLKSKYIDDRIAFEETSRAK
jgi:hypothetical protein